RSVPLALGGLVVAMGFTSLHTSPEGALLAAASGALASGLGYSLWYLALPELGAVRAALVQLLVPVITAVAAILLLDESLTWRLLVSGPLILGGVGLAILRRRLPQPGTPGSSPALPSAPSSSSSPSSSTTAKE